MDKVKNVISDKIKRNVLAACGNQCAHPDCKELIFDLGHETNIGQIAHIKGQKPKSARYDKNQTNEERNAFSNLIVLCGKHHRIIDDNEEKYSVEILYEWKKIHENKIACIDDNNWVTHSGSYSFNEKGNSTVIEFWIDKNGNMQVYTEEKYIKVQALKKFFYMESSLHQFLNLIDDIKDESQLNYLKQQKKELKLGEYGLHGNHFEIFKIIQDMTFGDYLQISTAGGGNMKDEFKAMGILKIEEEKRKLASNKERKFRK